MAEPYFKVSAMAISPLLSFRFGSKFTMTNSYSYDIK